MPNALLKKICSFVQLSPADQALLEEITQQTRTIAEDTDLIREGEAPGDVHLILDGFACRYKVLPNGSRQIVAYLIPGDFCDLHVFVLKAMDHNIGTLTPCTVVGIPRHSILDLLNRPAIAKALWWIALVDEAILREWLVSMGRRPADKRLAHLLCEMRARLRAVGLVSDGSYELPVTQAELGDTVGLSNVHVNRTLKDLREANLIALERGRITILDPDRMGEFAEFNANYLHLKGG